MAWIVVALAGSVLLFMPGLLEQFETPKIELVRACGLGALAYGLSAGRAGRPKRWTTLDRAVVAWLAVELLATALSLSPRVSLVGETRQREGLVTSIALVGLYFAARDAFARPGRPRPMELVLDLSLAVVSVAGLYALAQATGHDPFAWRREATFAKTLRPFATLGHPNLMGLVAAGGATVALARAIALGGAARGLRGAAALLLGVVTVITLSRAAWLGLAAGVGVAVALAARERGAMRPPSWRPLALAALGVVIVVSIAAALGALRPITQRVAELLAGGGASGSSRLEIWRSALAAWRARPLIGQGPDLFEMVFPRFQTAAYWRLEWSGLPFHAHSIYLHTLATRGALGLLASLACAAALLATSVAAWRRRAQAPAGLVPGTLGLLACSAVAGAFGALGIAGALLVILSMALLATAAETPAAEPAADLLPRRDPPGKSRAGRAAAPPRAEPTPRQWLARLAALVVTAVTLGYGFTELRGSRAASAAQAFMTTSPGRAVDASRYAVTLEPLDDRLWRMHAESLLWLTTLPDSPAGTLAEAERAARRAVALAPARAENRVILARALAAREAEGDTSAHLPAEAEFRSSLALAPMDGLTLMEYADHESMLGRPGPALAAAGRAAALYPHEGAAHAALARAWIAAREPDSARASLERAMIAGWRDPAERQAAQQMLDELGTPLVPARGPR